MILPHSLVEPQAIALLIGLGLDDPVFGHGICAKRDIGHDRIAFLDGDDCDALVIGRAELRELRGINRVAVAVEAGFGVYRRIALDCNGIGEHGVNPARKRGLELRVVRHLHTVDYVEREGSGRIWLEICKQ